MRNSQVRSKVAGFTLIELMIAVAIVAILVGVAMPSYQRHVIRSNRAAAQAVMLDLANREQQFLLANRRYADTATLIANGYALPAEVAAQYTLEVDTPAGAVPTYTITLTPIAGRRQASDGALSLDSSGVKTPVDKWK